ncbi:hypothetical protein Tco_0941653 [Tanacetum coccineum]|uniref:Uncharacterized protein n=1 Tax=Tanacetum coccineum TaxID=301880 RepID=A0ABQ5DU86_9ASTR
MNDENVMVLNLKGDDVLGKLKFLNGNEFGEFNEEVGRNEIEGENGLSDRKVTVICLLVIAVWIDSGKENEENIFQSIDEGLFKIGKFRETLAEGALHLGPERDSLCRPYTRRKKEMLLEGSELTKDERGSQLYDDFEHFHQNKGDTIHEYNVRFTKLINDMRNIKMTMPKMQLNSKFQHEEHANKNKMMLERYNQHAIDPLAFVSNISPQQVDRTEVRGTMLEEQLQLELGEFRTELAMPILVKQSRLSGQTNTFDDDVDEAPVQDLALNEDNVFQADQCDAFDSDVDEAHTAQTMFMANLSSADPIYDEAGPSYDSNILSEYVKDNAVQVVQSNVSYVPNDDLMMINNDMREQAVQCVSVNEHNKVVNESLTAEPARYKEQVEIYEKKARELHSVKMQLNSTINHNKLMKDEVATLKKDFKQKENKYLEEFLDMKALKEKVKDKLFKQDKSLQIVRMLCKPKPFYDEKKKVAIWYKNPLSLIRVMQVHSALYNVHEIVKTNHAPAIVHDSEDTLEIAEITRKKMLEKMKSPLCVGKKVKIAPPDYSKQNYLATFTPQRHLTPEQIFWSSDI